MKKQWKNARGITLVSLVITILVLVILVGVSVSTVLNSGLISNTKDAVAKYQESQENELKYINKIEMAITGNKLPSGYQEVEYIKSTGTQYIDTNFIPNQDTKIDIKFMMNNVSGKAIYGSRISYNNSTFSAMLSGVSANSSFQYSNVAVDVLTYQNGQTYHVVQDKNKLYVDNVLKQTFTYTNFNCPGNLYLFAVNQNGSIPFYGIISLFSFKIYDNSTLVRNFIPCYRKSDNVIGLYDTVNGVFYTNAGTGTFEKGNDI